MNHTCQKSQFQIFFKNEGGNAPNTTVNVTNSIELPKVNANGYIPNEASHNWDIDIQTKPKGIKFASFLRY